jgi:hypothetical protein
LLYDIYFVENEEVTLDTQVTAVPCADDSSTAWNMWKLLRAPYIIFIVLSSCSISLEYP